MTRKAPEPFKTVHPYAAGIDIGNSAHYVAVPPAEGKPNVRQFGTFTADLYAIDDWLKERGVTSVSL